MLIYHHPADNDKAKNWAIWKKIMIPRTLISSFSHADRDYFVTKEENSGIELVAEYASVGAAQIKYLAICNHSDADPFLGALRPSVIAINLNTQTIRNGVVTAL
tara:strand:- start:252 stop:563 length:312 start_codon:yes stop_codon:yes gene_type:complete